MALSLLRMKIRRSSLLARLLHCIHRHNGGSIEDRLLLNTPNLFLAFLSKCRPIIPVVLLSLLSRAPNPRAFKGQPRSWQLGSPLAQRDKRGVSAIITGFADCPPSRGARLAAVLYPLLANLLLQLLLCNLKAPGRSKWNMTC